MYYDYIIIGAGISGLYSLYKLLKLNPKTKILLLEKNRFGGRIGTFNFHGKTVTTGAGVGRNKDKLLKQLLKELNIPITKFKLKLTTPYKNTIPQILHKFKKFKPFMFETFQEYGLRVLGAKQLHHFIVNSGYTDYLQANAIETLQNYGFDDVLPGFKGFYVPWNLLLDKLHNLPGNWEYKTETVTNFNSYNNTLFKIITNNNIYIGKNVIFAVPPFNLNKIKCGLANPKIKSQPFSRTYIKTKEPLGIPENGVFNCVSLIQKIIPLGDNIYMLYNDNLGAKWLKTASKKDIKKELIYELEHYLKRTVNNLSILDIEKIYWEHGTHYYALYPNDMNLIPYKGVYIVGEAYSSNQGWVEGALETVEKCLD
jgi:hypothetical protein